MDTTQKEENRASDFSEGFDKGLEQASRQDWKLWQGWEVNKSQKQMNEMVERVMMGTKLIGDES